MFWRPADFATPVETLTPAARRTPCGFLAPTAPHKTKDPNYELIVHRFVATRNDFQSAVMAKHVHDVPKLNHAMGPLEIFIGTNQADRLAPSSLGNSSGQLDANARHKRVKQALDLQSGKITRGDSQEGPQLNDIFGQDSYYLDPEEYKEGTRDEK